jgi:hypothetical protein
MVIIKFSFLNPCLEGAVRSAARTLPIASIKLLAAESWSQLIAFLGRGQPIGSYPETA